MTSAETAGVQLGSFRDPSGHVFTRGGRIYRQINTSYAADYDHLMASGLCRTLADRGLLIPHREVAEPPDNTGGVAGVVDIADVYRVIEPERIPFISYPFEWSFSQLKKAAAATLAIQRLAVDRGMVLKDASAYNIQFRGHLPVLIDTLSFERWREGTPWVAYRQFCQHFLGALALMSRTDVRLGQLSRLFIDGAPLDLVCRLLPFSSRVSPSLLMHLHLHARAQERHGSGAITNRQPDAFKRRSMLGLIDSLESAVEAMTCEPARGPWADYYSHTNYSAGAMADKHRVVDAFIERQRPGVVWDLGANTGAFSRLASARGAYTLALDGDPDAVERHYVDVAARRDDRVLPLVMDLANPSGRIGWSHAERLSLLDRGPADLVLALGLIHHLSLSNQVPFERTAEFFHQAGRALVIEFVPPSDSQVAGMLSRMPRLQPGYSLDAFEHGFARWFDVVEVAPVADSERRLYLMRSKERPA